MTAIIRRAVRAVNPRECGRACACVSCLPDAGAATMRGQHRGEAMAKAYWIAAYRSIRDEQAFAEYVRLAVPALQAAGARVLARGMPARIYESGIQQRTVLMEFASVAQAIQAHESPGYQDALRALGNGADRDMRIIEGTD
jgi:uncharacterized protein (DUF1330 family)